MDVSSTVLYLDSVDLGQLSIPHNSFPRIQHFSYDTIRSMISADSNFVNYVNGNNDARPTDLRDAVHSCQFTPSAAPRTGCLLSIWESCVAMATSAAVVLLSTPITNQ